MINMEIDTGGGGIFYLITVILDMQSFEQKFVPYLLCVYST